MTNGNLTDWYTYPTNSTIDGLGSFIQFVNNSADGYLGYGFLLIIFLTTFGFSMVAGSRKALLTSSFITFIFSIYLARLGLINIMFVILLIIMTIIGALGSRQEQTL